MNKMLANDLKLQFYKKQFISNLSTMISTFKHG